MDVKRIGVVGAGTMGRGIAQTCAASGFEVVMSDVSEEAVAAGLAAIGKQLARAVEKGRMSAAEKDAVLSRIRTATGIEAMAGVDVCIEAATEHPDIKLELFRALEPVCGEEAILASNTSSISLTKIAGACSRPERVIGMHFFNPVPLMQLVEVIRAMQTSDATFEAAKALAERLGKTAVAVADSPGFVVNRMLVPMINEAVFAYDEGLASAEEIDLAMQLGPEPPDRASAACGPDRARRLPLRDGRDVPGVLRLEVPALPAAAEDGGCGPPWPQERARLLRIRVTSVPGPVLRPPIRARRRIVTEGKRP